jgi:SNF2 family DNA or RNA helicase
MFNGTMERDERASALSQFDRAGPGAVLIMSPEAGGAGLNITAASRMIFSSPLWNKSDEDQAVARCWRKGQHRPVHVYHLVGANSVMDAMMVQGAAQKRSVTNHMMSYLRQPDGAEVPSMYINPITTVARDMRAEERE